MPTEGMAKRILVIRLSSLGDIVLTTPVYRNLKDAWPTCWISVLVKERFVSALSGHPAVDEVIPWQAHVGFLRQLLGLRRHRFDLVIDLHATLRAWLISRGIGETQRLRYRKASWARRVLVWWKRRPPALSRHTVDRYLDTLRALGLTPRCYPPDLVAGHETKTSSPWPGCPGRVLIIQTAFLGDAVLTTPLVKAIKERFPGVLVMVSCTPETAEVFRGTPGVTALVIDDKRGSGNGLLKFWRLVRHLRSLSCDVAFLPHRSVRTAWLAWLAGVPRRVGFETSPGRWWYTDQVPFLWGEHNVHRILRLLDPLGDRGAVAVQQGDAHAEISFPRVTVEPLSARTAEGLLKQPGISMDDLLVGMAPGSLWATKRWLPERFAAVADALIDEVHARILLFGAVADRPVVGEVQRRMRHPCVNLAGRTSLAELIALIGRCRLFLSNDSGAMHIAVATGVATIALFGPTTQELGFAPYGEGHQVIERELPCRPCSLHGGARCPEGHFHCMRWISTEEVLDAAKAKLRQGLVPA